MMHVAYPLFIEPCGVHFLIRSESSSYQPLRLKIYKKKNMKQKMGNSRGSVSEGRVKK